MGPVGGMIKKISGSAKAGPTGKNMKEALYLVVYHNNKMETQPSHILFDRKLSSSYNVDARQ